VNIFNHNAVTLCVANEDQFSNLTNDWLSLFSTQALNLSEHIDAYYIDFNSENLPSVDDIRRGLSFVWTGPRLSAYKYLVLHHVQHMHASVANALLKLLEEPPAYLRCLLLSTSRERVLKTIQSRCVLIDCQAQSSNIEWLIIFNQYLQSQIEDEVLIRQLMNCHDHECCINQLMHLVHMISLHVYNEDLHQIWLLVCALSGKVKSKITWNAANLTSEYLILMQRIRQFAQAN
jgi:hypothetical protein